MSIFRVELKATTSPKAKKKKKNKGATGSVKKVKKSCVAKVTLQGGKDAKDFDSIMPEDDNFVQVTGLTKKSAVSLSARKKLRTK